MVPINWREIILKALPLIPTIIMYVASYRLSIAKNAKEEKQDQFNRLNEENARLTGELEKKDKKIEDLQQRVEDLQDELNDVRKVAAMAPTAGIVRKDDDNNDS